MGGEASLADVVRIASRRRSASELAELRAMDQMRLFVVAIRAARLADLPDQHLLVILAGAFGRVMAARVPADLQPELVSVLCGTMLDQARAADLEAGRGRGSAGHNTR